MITYDTTEAPRQQQEEAPVTRVYGHPLDEVHRVDALDCEAAAAFRVGTRLVCHYHRLEVAHALWEADARQPMFDVDEAAGYRCGETYPAVTR